MRLPLPERFSVRQMLAFATTLMVVQLLEGTDLTFAALVFCYVILTATAYNLAGGFFYPSGAWILFTGLETTLIGLTYKAALLEPAQTNLRAPNQTMLVYCGGMLGMGAAAWVNRLLRPGRGLLAGFSVGAQMKESAIGCLVIGIPLMYLQRNGVHETASVASALNQLNHFLPLAILLGTTYEIHASGGRRSTNWVVWTAGLLIFGMGVVNFSKEGMFTPVVTWLIPTIVLRFRFSRAQVLGAFAALAFTGYYLVPFSQAGRGSRDTEGNFANNLQSALTFLSDLEGTRKLYLESGLVANIDEIPHLYNESGGLFDRLQMLAFDDALIQITDDGSVFGLSPAVGTFVNAIPRFLWKNKPEYLVGNVYGRQIGVITENDTSTGISFSPTGDAYHEAKWFGVLVVEPIIMFILFFVMDSLSGDVRLSPWGLLFIALSAHAAPEGQIPGTIWVATYGAEGVIFAAVISGYVTPFLSRLLTLGGSARSVPVQTAGFRMMMPPRGANGAQ
jgi:hypothetical protein